MFHASILVSLVLISSLVTSTPLQRKDATPQSAMQSAISKSSGSLPTEKRSLDEIYQAAMKETGTLRVAWGGDVQASKIGITNAFKKRFPNITLEIELDVSKYLDGTINHNYASTNEDGVDVAVLQSVHNFPRWKEQGRLLPYKVAPWDDIYPEFVDEDGAYTGLHIFTLGYQVYNPLVINNETLPKTYLDFLLPEWRDRLILTYPNDDDAVLFLFKGITDKYGFDYFDKLKAQGTRWVRGTATPSILIANSNPKSSADADVNTHSISFASSDAFTRGVAVDRFDDVYMTWPQTGAIFATTKMPESARLFMGFLMDDQWQGIVSGGRYATRRKFDGAKILEQKGREPMNYVNFMNDREKVESWRLQVEKVLGTASGANPVDEW